MNPAIVRFWRDADIADINPAITEDSEGWDVREQLRELFEERAVSDIGCGYGRLCTAFSPDRYIGYDLNPSALQLARQRNPAYRFVLMVDTSDYAIEDGALLYTVLLHVHDEDIQAVAAELCRRSKRVVVAEVMGRSWRRAGNPPVFNREAQDYITLFETCGFGVEDIVARPYARYPNTSITFLVFDRNSS